MKRYRLKLSLPGKAAAIAKVFPNAFTFVAYLSTDQVEKFLAVEFVLMQFNISATLEEA